MSMVSVHTPLNAQPFYAANDELVVNLLGPLELEVKSLLREGVQGEHPYTWDFGDGSPEQADGYEMTHTYGTPGRKTVRVKINTDEGVKTASITFDLGDETVPPTEDVELDEETQDHRAA
jgi:PKD repeat protein